MKRALIIIVIIGTLCFLWWFYTPEHDKFAKLTEMLMEALPLVLITAIIGWDSSLRAEEMEKINRDNLFLRKEEKHLQEIEAWAQEMCVCTPWENEDVVTKQATAGIKHAFSRHMLTRFGKNYGGPFTFPMVNVNSGGDSKTSLAWKIRFAEAVINYMHWYDSLMQIVRKHNNKNSENNNAEYGKSFVGRLYDELVNAYGKNPDRASIMTVLQQLPISQQTVMVVMNPTMMIVNPTQEPANDPSKKA